MGQQSDFMTPSTALIVGASIAFVVALLAPFILWVLREKRKLAAAEAAVERATFHQSPYGPSPLAHRPRSSSPQEGDRIVLLTNYGPMQMTAGTELRIHTVYSDRHYFVAGLNNNMSLFSRADYGTHWRFSEDTPRRRDHMEITEEYDRDGQSIDTTDMEDLMRTFVSDMVKSRKSKKA